LYKNIISSEQVQNLLTALPLKDETHIRLSYCMK